MRQEQIGQRQTKRGKRWWFAAVLCSCLCALSVPVTALEKAVVEEPVMHLSEEPYASGRILQGKLQPVLEYLRNRGINASYLRTESYRQYVAHAADQQIDIAFASPGLASLLINRYGYRPVLAQDNRLNAVVVVRADSTVKSLADLAGGFILIPEPYDLVTELGKRLLKTRGLEQQLLPRLVETSKVDRILLSVINREFDAGIVAGYDLALLSTDVRRQLRILDSSEEVTAHFILLRKDMPLERQQRIVSAMRSLHSSPEGERYARDFGSSQFVPPTGQNLQELQEFRTFGDFIGGINLD